MEAPTLLRVTDTRDYVEVGDRWVPVPGSGVAHDCARCGREHEVHAEVRYADGLDRRRADAMAMSMHDERDAALSSAWDRIERVRRALGGVVGISSHDYDLRVAQAVPRRLRRALGTRYAASGEHDMEPIYAAARAWRRCQPPTGGAA